VPQDEIKSVLDQHPIFRLAEVYRRDILDLEIKPLRENDRLVTGDTKLVIIECPGHTPGSICLYDGARRIMFVGDVVLQEITPSIILHKLSQDPLDEHFKSLEKIASMNPRIIYPGHREVINDPIARVNELIEFHKRRLDEIISYLKEKDHSAYELAKRIRWRVKYSGWDMFPPVEKFFAIGETLAHLTYLLRRGFVDFYEKDNRIYWYISNK